MAIGLRFSPEGDTVVSTGVDGTVAVWDVGEASKVDTLDGHSRSAWQAAFSPDGRELYTSGYDGVAIARDTVNAADHDASHLVAPPGRRRGRDDSQPPAPVGGGFGSR
jgi:WD40 repeat protein